MLTASLALEVRENRKRRDHRGDNAHGLLVWQPAVVITIAQRTTIAPDEVQLLLLQQLSYSSHLRLCPAEGVGGVLEQHMPTCRDTAGDNAIDLLQETAGTFSCLKHCVSCCAALGDVDDTPLGPRTTGMAQHGAVRVLGLQLEVHLSDACP
jgi:hypothetical protein